MEVIRQLFSNYVLLVSMLTGLLAQVIKFILTIITDKKVVFERLQGDGGFPSAHSAIVTSLMILIGYTSGVGSTVFALSFVFACVVMKDAMGVRRETGKQAKTLNELLRAYNETAEENGEKPVLGERLKVLVGHTPLQVLAGILLGILTSVFYILVLAP